MNDDSRANKSGTPGIDETRWQQVEVEFGLDLFRSHVDYNGVTSIVTSSAACADVHLLAENVGQLACGGRCKRESASTQAGRSAWIAGIAARQNKTHPCLHLPTGCPGAPGALHPAPSLLVSVMTPCRIGGQPRRLLDDSGLDKEDANT